jgi:hypothetical protein
MTMPGDYENEKVPLVKGGGGGGREMAMRSHMKQTGRSVEELLVAVKETVVDVADAFRSGGKQSLAQRTQDVIHAQTPRLRNALRHVVADVLLWMQQGGLWRTLLVSAVGMISATALTGFTAFMLVVLIATTNAVFVGLLMSLSAVGAFIAMFFTSLTVIYIGALTATAFALGTVAFMAICAILFVTGWIAFAWVSWEIVKKGLHIAKTTLGITGNALTTVSNAGSAQAIIIDTRSS